MTVRELINRLNEFDGDHDVRVFAESTHVAYDCNVDDVAFTDGVCTITAQFSE